MNLHKTCFSEFWFRSGFRIYSGFCDFWIKAISSFSFRAIFFKLGRKLLWVGALKTCFPEFWFRSGLRIHWPFCPVNNLVNKSYLLLQFSTDFFQTRQKCSLHKSTQNLFSGILIRVRIPDLFRFLWFFNKSYLLLQFSSDFFSNLTGNNYG